MNPPRTPHELACDLVKQHPDPKALSEADTRHRIIDAILHDVLSWPRAAVVCEPYIDPGYADYVLTGAAESQLLFIEAKRGSAGQSVGENGGKEGVSSSTAERRELRLANRRSARFSSLADA
jgi:hypothetical protein